VEDSTVSTVFPLPLPRCPAGALFCSGFGATAVIATPLLFYAHSVFHTGYLASMNGKPHANVRVLPALELSEKLLEIFYDLGWYIQFHRTLLTGSTSAWARNSSMCSLRNLTYFPIFK
jgi:hypothetical protein